ncbi:alpha/beta hydrolase [Luteibacter sp. NPDC031894]|uniref:alpha/beta hydrolase n=1 Tax=Luteibacter sp. NPDC031894 TaxID=3390572 RepID=UPI003CFBCC6C
MTRVDVGRSPAFRFEGGREGVLLVHGLGRGADEMRQLGKGLNRAGFTVVGIELAGHGGTEDELLASGWRDWYASVEAAADELRGQVDRVFVAGSSMGALLALRLAAVQPAWVAGVGVFGVTFRYDGWSAGWAARISFMLPLFKRLGIGRHRRLLQGPPQGFREDRLRDQFGRTALPGAVGVADRSGDSWHALAETVELARDVRRRLPAVTAPCFIAHALDDEIASTGNADLVARHVRGPVEMLLLADSYHMITVDRERRMLIERSADFFDRIAREARASRVAA